MQRTSEHSSFHFYHQWMCRAEETGRGHEERNVKRGAPVKLQFWRDNRVTKVQLESILGKVPYRLL